MDADDIERARVVEWLMYHGYWLGAGEVCGPRAREAVDREFTQKLEFLFIQLGHCVSSASVRASSPLVDFSHLDFPSLSLSHSLTHTHTQTNKHDFGAAAAIAPARPHTHARTHPLFLTHL